MPRRRRWILLRLAARQALGPVIEALAANPKPEQGRLLVNTRNLWRIKCGDYRVLYRIEDHRCILHKPEKGGLNMTCQIILNYAAYLSKKSVPPLETVFGHKVCLAGGASGLITDCTIEYGNPPDSHLAPKMIGRHKGIFKKLPRQAAFDGGFASKSNLRAIKAYGVKDCAFHKKRGIEICDMVKSSWVYKQLRNFRAGIEGCISYLKRAFAMDRCKWRGRQSFDAYVWTSILTHNLLVLARHCMGKNLL